ncbi:MAG: TlyA family RNA methyltransferase [Pseudomonadota bacterium]
MTKIRADKLLIDRGVFASRAAARAAIEAGSVRADGRRVTKPSERLDLEANLEAQPAHPYVSRGGVKLAHAFARWPGLDVEGAACLDLGASTGGFTDVLLMQGAARVTAVDVGTGQLHARLAGDRRVHALEQTDARNLTAAQIEAPDLIVCDVSFIALEKLLAPVLAQLGPSTRCALVLLFKPQFQVGRVHVGRGGIVRDQAASAAAEARFAAWLAGQGWPSQDWADSPITGGDGNAERLVWARPGE